MAVGLPATETPDTFIWPELDDEELDRIRVKDASSIDYLYVFLTGAPVPAVWDPREEPGVWVGLRMTGEDEWTNEVVAVMIANFRHAALRRHPDWRQVIATAGEERRMALRRFIAEVAKIPGGQDVELEGNGS